VALEAMKNNDLSIALDELKQAAGLAPSNALIWYNIAVVESKKGDSKAALEHLHKATSLGLPSSQQEDVDKLEAKLTYDLKKKTLSEKQPGTPAVPKTTAGARESSMRALNTGINEIGAITADYQPIGFILETSTGKLWWRSLDARADELRYGCRERG
jgi:tetratricopeptide (TPR) repeat protein